MLSSQTSANPRTFTCDAPLTVPQSTIGTVTNWDSLPVIEDGSVPPVIRPLTAALTGPQFWPGLVAMMSPNLTSQVQPLVMLFAKRFAPPPVCGPIEPFQFSGMFNHPQLPGP